MTDSRKHVWLTGGWRHSRLPLSNNTALRTRRCVVWSWECETAQYPNVSERAVGLKKSDPKLVLEYVAFPALLYSILYRTFKVQAQGVLEYHIPIQYCRDYHVFAGNRIKFFLELLEVVSCSSAQFSSSSRCDQECDHYNTSGLRTWVVTRQRANTHGV